MLIRINIVLFFTYLTWEDALLNDSGGDDGGMMPMSMKKSVSSARILHNKFISFMPHPYYYDPLEVNDDTATAREDELLDRENAIYENWCTAFGNDDDTDQKRFKNLSNEVKEWYGLSIDQSGSTELDDSFDLLSLD